MIFLKRIRGLGSFSQHGQVEPCGTEQCQGVKKCQADEISTSLPLVGGCESSEGRCLVHWVFIPQQLEAYCFVKHKCVIESFRN